MGVVDRKKRLFENIVRLRRALRDLPHSEDLVAVRTSLEEELGETVSRNLAANLLGVSHTALTRWIDAGDLPVVYARSGRMEVPVAALLDLWDAVDRERQSGRRRRHVLEPIMTTGRDRAERIRVDDLLVGEMADADGHRVADLRSLAYHRALAKRLRRPMVDEARQLLWKWRDQGTIDSRYAARWEEVLNKPIPEIRRALEEDSQRSRDLRQTSPFAGMLSEPERRRIMQSVG